VAIFRVGRTRIQTYFTCQDHSTLKNLIVLFKIPVKW